MTAYELGRRYAMAKLANIYSGNVGISEPQRENQRRAAGIIGGDNAKTRMRNVDLGNQRDLNRVMRVGGQVMDDAVAIGGKTRAGLGAAATGLAKLPGLVSQLPVGWGR